MLRNTLTLLALVALGCSGKDDDTLADQTDGSPSTTGDTGEGYPAPGPLEVGFARVRMPAPVGIGTAGFNGIGVPGDNSPFQELFPGTRGIHGHPDFRATAISRGEGHTVIFLRSDTVGVFQQLRRSVVLELEERTGRRDLDDALIIGATHTHSGPGRVVDGGGAFDLIADKFFPEFYEGMVDAMADAVEQALDDLAPGRIGVVFADGSDSIHDRRCEDGRDHVNGSIPVLAVERDGELAGLVLAHGIHGTVHGNDELLLSQDVSGGIEAAISEVVGKPIHVQMFNSWGADISPDASEAPPLGSGAALSGGQTTIASIGQLVGDDVAAALLDIPWEDEPELWTRTLRTGIDREHIGYAEDEFPYEYGAVYCTAEGDCDPATTEDNLDHQCLVQFSEEFPAPNQTEFTVGRVGGVHLLTFPGEPGTLLAERVIDGVSAWVDGPVMFVGYGQDYLGYSILEDDWWQGGYEASGALWGPRQGEYLAAELVEAMGEALGQVEAQDRPAAVAPFDDSTYEPYLPATPSNLGMVLAQPTNVGPTDVIVATVAGEDPWLGAPLATLQHADGTPVLRADGTPLTSDHPLFEVHLEVDPTWVTPASTRTFRWTFEVAARHPVQGAMPVLDGDYRLEVRSGSGDLIATTDVFTVAP